MKKNTSFWLFIPLIVVIVGLLIYLQGNKKLEFTKKITLRSDDQHPYGASLAFEWLKDIFPNSDVKVLSTSVINKQDLLGLNSSLLPGDYAPAKAMIILTKSFYATDTESNTLLRFVEQGNDLFLSCLKGSSDFLLKTGVSLIDSTDFDNFLQDYPDEKFSFQLDTAIFHTKQSYSLNGIPYFGRISNYNPRYAKVLGTCNTGRAGVGNSIGHLLLRSNILPNFIKYRYGKGHIYIHTAPVAFTNYFLLKKNNKEYYEKVLSQISPDVKTIIWDNYFVNGYHNSYAKEKSPFDTLFKQPSFRWAIWLIIIMTLAYILIELKRRQRETPVYQPLKNDALDYVKTMGRLYFDKKDNYNLAAKMSLYFMEYVRSNFTIDTSELNDSFVNQLAHKSGKSPELINLILTNIHSFKDVRQVKDEEIRSFYESLEEFYNHN